MGQQDLLANGSFDRDANDDGWPDAWLDYRASRLTWPGGRAEALEAVRTARGLALALPAQGHYELAVH